MLCCVVTHTFFSTVVGELLKKIPTDIRKDCPGSFFWDHVCQAPATLFPATGGFGSAIHIQYVDFVPELGWKFQSLNLYIYEYKTQSAQVLHVVTSHHTSQKNKIKIDSMPGPNTKFGVSFPSHIFTNTLPIWLKIGSSCS